MGNRVSVLFLIESAGAPPAPADVILESMLRPLFALEREPTILLTGERARQLRAAKPRDLLTLIRRQDVAFGPDKLDQPSAFELVSGLDWEQGVRKLFEQQAPSYHDVAFLAGRIPSSYGSHCWIPQMFGALDQWAIRVELSRNGFVDAAGEPFFLSGRLNLSNLGPNSIDVRGPSLDFKDVVQKVAHRVEAQTEHGGVVCLRFLAEEWLSADPDGLESAVRDLVKQIDAMEEAVILSARQIADRYADISYEHRIAITELLSIAKHATKPNLTPFHYAAGYLSPAEQLYLLANAWDETRRKGKLVRNSTTRTPLGPTEQAETTATLRGLGALKVTQILGELVAYMSKHNRLPASLPIEDEGVVALQDLLPTLASGFHESLVELCLPIKRGRIADQDRVRQNLADRAVGGKATPKLMELARLQLWTFKPILGIGKSSD
jgi:hypothetical protein